MTKNDLIERVWETTAGYLALGNESFTAEGATFIRNRSTPRRHDSNHVGVIRAADQADIDMLLLRTDIEFEGFNHRRFDTDPSTPPEFVARLSLDGGYRVDDTLWLLLEGELQAVPRRIDVREVLHESDWAAFEGLDGLNQREGAEQHGRTFDLAAVHDFVVAKRLKCPPVRTWLAIEQDEPRAFFSSWPGDNGVGMVEDLFTHPESRHRGLATALIAHSVTDARARGAGPIIIGADPNDTPKLMYAAMGFRPLYVSRNYFKMTTILNLHHEKWRAMRHEGGVHWHRPYG